MNSTKRSEIAMMDGEENCGYIYNDRELQLRISGRTTAEVHSVALNRADHARTQGFVSIARSVGEPHPAASPGSISSPPAEPLSTLSLTHSHVTFPPSISGSGLIYAGDTIKEWNTCTHQPRESALRAGNGNKERAPYYLALAHIALGLCAVAFQAGALGVYAELAYVGAGIWSGIVFVSLGAALVASNKWHRDWLVSSVYVLAALTFITAIVGLVITTIALSREAKTYYHYYQGSARMFMCGFLVSVFLLELGVTTWSLSISCRNTGVGGWRRSSTDSVGNGGDICRRSCCCCYALTDPATAVSRKHTQRRPSSGYCGQ